jgi:superfamily I DNA and/or RNA helicase
MNIGSLKKKTYYYIHEIQLFRVLNVIDGLEQLADQSFKNEKEAILVAKIVMLIVNSPLTRGKSVGVITFYRSQQQCIVKKMNEEGNRLK